MGHLVQEVDAVPDTGLPGIGAEAVEQLPAADSAAAAVALDKLVDMGREGRERMGAEGRRRCEQRWAWPALLDRMDEAYAEAIGARREKLGERVEA